MEDLTYLNDGRIVRKTPLEGWPWFRRLAHPDVLDVGTTEDYVLVGLIPRGHGTVSGAVLSTIGTNWKKTTKITTSAFPSQ